MVHLNSPSAVRTAPLPQTSNRGSISIAIEEPIVVDCSPSINHSEGATIKKVTPPSSKNHEGSAGDKDSNSTRTSDRSRRYTEVSTAKLEVPMEQRDLEGSDSKRSSPQSRRKSSAVSDESDAPLLSGALIAYMAVFVDFFGLGIILPLLPFFVADENASSNWLGAILTAQYGGVVIGSLLLGYISDKVGRKPALLTALIGDVFLFAASAFAPSVQTLLAIRLLAGIFTPVSPAMAWLVASVTPAQRPKVLSKFSASMMSGFLVGTIGGSTIGLLGWEVANLTAAGVALIVATLTAKSQFIAAPVAETSITSLSEVDDVNVPPPAPTAASTALNIRIERDGTVTKVGQKQNSNKAHLVKMPNKVFQLAVWRAVAHLQFQLGVAYGVNVTLTGLILKENYGYTEFYVGLAYFVFVAFMIATNIFFYQPVFKKMGDRSLLILGSAIHAVSFSSLVFARHDQYAYILISSVTIVAMAMEMPTCMFTATVLAQKHSPMYVGTILGTTRAMYNVGQAVGPIIATLTYGVYQWLPFAVTGGLLVLACLIFAVSAYYDPALVKKREALQRKREARMRALIARVENHKGRQAEYSTMSVAPDSTLSVLMQVAADYEMGINRKSSDVYRTTSNLTSFDDEIPKV